MFKKIKPEHLLVAFITLVGAILRLWDAANIPLMNDELSAIFRTHYDSLGELFEKGIKPDGHPAFVQLFLYYWIQIGGENSVWIKFPFLLMGIACIPLTYIACKKWFNETAAIVCCTYIASLQYTIFYSQLARPYICGLFLALLFIIYWSKIIKENKYQWKTIILYILFGFLTATTHYFSLLTIAVVGFLGLYLVNKEFRLKYVLLNLALIVAYLPNISIFLYQLDTGGVGGWLSKPSSIFIIDYFDYVMNFSWWVKWTVIILLAWGLKNIFENRMLWFFFISFALVFLIGYIYSVKVNPVLQYSVLIFAFPFILFFLFGNIPNIKPRQLLTLVFCVLCINVFSLIKERQYYSYFYQSPHQEILKEANEYYNKEVSKPLVLLFTNSKFNQYFNERYKYNFRYIDLNEHSESFTKFLKDTLLSYKGDKLLYGALSSEDPMWLPYLQQFFPYIEVKKDYFIGSFYVLSKTKPGNSVDELILDSLIFSKPVMLDSTIEWTTAYEFQLDKLLKHENNIIDILYELESDSTISKASIVSELLSDTLVKQWREQNINIFQLNKSKFLAIHSLNMADTKQLGDNLKLKFFLWNKAHQKLRIKQIKLQVRKGNPLLYGFYEKI